MPPLPPPTCVPPSDLLTFPPSLIPLFTPYLPTPPSPSHPLPFLTLTFATSLDSALSLGPGLRTVLSGPASKAMTHFLRSRHAAILIGVNTTLADDPSLNCRLPSPSGTHTHPRPIILDPRARWRPTPDAKVLALARAGHGLAPFVLVAEGTAVDAGVRDVVEGHGGRYIAVAVGEGGRFAWRNVLGVLQGEGLESVMVEGGGEEVVDAVVLTVAPTWVERGRAAARVEGGRWIPLGEDVVLCGRLKKD
ncbi:dihydrofolate reductase-like domain-containing protein [Schizothecium vesticola]|uniref:2,5-diamino-6-ribosylamino-4(3H)-pyrimidinone 5'-phosphate reductase n=1 Tax=Schizothecium vesticola TaxID=314040 RepID=A0AA40K9T4_9PEZI|nr:dihydrofolate reductase-like domain-containing protein [Schizothecium vesticola]